MTEDRDEELAESHWREEFRQRIIAARGNRTQSVMAELLGINQSAYSKYEAPTRKSVMPLRHLPRFAKICGVTLEWLIDGPPKEAAAPKRESTARAEKPVARPARRRKVG